MNGASGSEAMAHPPPRPMRGQRNQIVPAIGGAERDAGKFQHVQYVGEAQFMRDREREHVRLHDVRVAFQRGEADAVFAEEPAGFPAGGVHAFGKDVFPIVEDGIQDFMSEVGHAILVQIREGKGSSAGERTRAPCGRNLPRYRYSDWAGAAGRGVLS